MTQNENNTLNHKASFCCAPLPCRATLIPIKIFSAVGLCSQMDFGRRYFWRRKSHKAVIVTVAVQEMNFIRPVKVGNVVCCYGRCVSVGNTSLQLKIEVWVKTLMNDHLTEDRQLVTEAVFTYVAIDSEGNKRPIPKEGNPKLEGLI